MRAITPALQALLNDGVVVCRDYLWIGAKRRDNGATVERGFWSDNGSTFATVRRVNGNTVSRPYVGGVGLVAVSTVPLVTGLTAQPVTVSLAATEEAVLQLVKEWSIRRAPVEIHRGFLDPRKMRLIEPAELRFIGFADEPDFQTGAYGDESTVTISCAPHTQELLRTSERMRSDADQRRRDANDGGFRHVDKPPRQLEWASE